MRGFKATLLTGRSLKQGMGKEVSKTSDRYKESVSICEVHPNDMENAGLKEGDLIRVTTKFGSVIVKCVPSDHIPKPGIIFIPYGPYASSLIGISTDSTGMPTFKGASAEVEAAPEEKVLDIKQLLTNLVEE